MKTFDEYVLDWWHNYLDEAEEHTLNALMEDLIGEEETIDDYIPQDAESPREWLKENMSAGEVYDRYFGYDKHGFCPDNMPDTFQFVRDMLKENVAWPDGSTTTMPSFADEFLDNMAAEIEGYDYPLACFEDLTKYGCQSGMVGFLIYNSDCKRIYIEHMDDMEEWKNLMEDEMGAIKNEQHLPHYTFMCWLCYEELAFSIARALYPDEF